MVAAGWLRDTPRHDGRRPCLHLDMQSLRGDRRPRIYGAAKAARRAGTPFDADVIPLQAAAPNDELTRIASESARMNSATLTIRCPHNHQTAYGRSSRQIRLIGSGPRAEDRTLPAIAWNPWCNPLTGASRRTCVCRLGGSICSLCVFHDFSLAKYYCQRRGEKRRQSFCKNCRGSLKQLGSKSILLPTDDEAAVFVAEHAAMLCGNFVLPTIEPGLRGFGKQARFEPALRTAQCRYTRHPLCPVSRRRADVCADGPIPHSDQE